MDGKKLVWYDLDKNKFRKLRMRGIPIDCNSFAYSESLLKLTMDKPLQQMPSKGKQDKNLQREGTKCAVILVFGFHFLPCS